MPYVVHPSGPSEKWTCWKGVSSIADILAGNVVYQGGGSAAVTQTNRFNMSNTHEQ